MHVSSDQFSACTGVLTLTAPPTSAAMTAVTGRQRPTDRCRQRPTPDRLPTCSMVSNRGVRFGDCACGLSQSRVACKFLAICQSFPNHRFSRLLVVCKCAGPRGTKEKPDAGQINSLSKRVTRWIGDSKESYSCSIQEITRWIGNKQDNKFLPLSKKVTR